MIDSETGVKEMVVKRFLQTAHLMVGRLEQSVPLKTKGENNERIKST